MVKIAHLAEFWLILERNLVERALHKIFVELIWNYYKEYYKLYPNQHIFFTKFGFVMKKLWHFYPKHLFLTSFRTSHKPYFPLSVTPKLQWPTSWIFYHRYLDMFSHFRSNFKIWIIIEKKIIVKMVRWPVDNIP